MRALLHTFVALVAAALFWSSAANAQKRVALVVGNSAYVHTPALGNPKNDAGDVAAALGGFGFEVVEGYDLDKAGFDRTIRSFAAALQGADVGVFFYAGHGIQVQGQNYLVPVDAELSAAAALDFEMVRLDLIQRTMENHARTNILFLDACRDNPLARNLARSMGTRSAGIGRGLATVEGGVGTLISFSTQPGNVALDGGGRNSPFAGALVRNMRASGDDLSALLIAVRNDVMKATANKQIPWEHSSLTGRFYFNPSGQASAAQTAAAPPAPAAARDQAADAWAAAKDSTSPAVLEAFVTRFGNSFYAELARERLRSLQAKQTAAAAPRATPPASAPPASARQSDDKTSQQWTLAGNKTVDLLNGEIIFTMIGTPHGSRRDLVGVRVNGQMASLAVGDFVHVGRQNAAPCGIFLMAIDYARREADFQLVCGAAFGDVPRKQARLSVTLSDATSGGETFTMSRGTSRQFQADGVGVLFTFISTPYGSRRDLVGVRVHGEAKSMAVGQRLDVAVGARTCGVVLREIHVGKGSAEFLWQC